MDLSLISIQIKERKKNCKIDSLRLRIVIGMHSTENNMLAELQWSLLEKQWSDKFFIPPEL